MADWLEITAQSSTSPEPPHLPQRAGGPPTHCLHAGGAQEPETRRRGNAPRHSARWATQPIAGPFRPARGWGPRGSTRAELPLAETEPPTYNPALLALECGWCAKRCGAEDLRHLGIPRLPPAAPPPSWSSSSPSPATHPVLQLTAGSLMFQGLSRRSDRCPGILPRLPQKRNHSPSPQEQSVMEDAGGGRGMRNRTGRKR